MTLHEIEAIVREHVNDIDDTACVSLACALYIACELALDTIMVTMTDGTNLRVGDVADAYDGLCQRVGDTAAANGQLWNRVHQLEARVVVLTKALTKYGSHLLSCRLGHEDDDPCPCGLDAALATDAQEKS